MVASWVSVWVAWNSGGGQIMQGLAEHGRSSNVILQVPWSSWRFLGKTVTWLPYENGSVQGQIRTQADQPSQGIWLLYPLNCTDHPGCGLLGPSMQNASLRISGNQPKALCTFRAWITNAPLGLGGRACFGFWIMSCILKHVALIYLSGILSCLADIIIRISLALKR